MSGSATDVFDFQVLDGDDPPRFDVAATSVSIFKYLAVSLNDT